jgi:hypothetical protein
MMIIYEILIDEPEISRDRSLFLPEIRIRLAIGK